MKVLKSVSKCFGFTKKECILSKSFNILFECGIHILCHFFLYANCYFYCNYLFNELLLLLFIIIYYH